MQRYSLQWHDDEDPRSYLHRAVRYALQHEPGTLMRVEQLAVGESVAFPDMVRNTPRSRLVVTRLEDYHGPVLLEVAYEHRPGRGKYWRASGSGYTDDIADAGLFGADSPDVKRAGRAYPVEALPVISRAYARQSRRLGLLAGLMQRCDA